MACLLCKVSKQTNPKLVALTTLLLVDSDGMGKIFGAMCETHRKLAEDTFAAAHADPEFEKRA